MSAPDPDPAKVPLLFPDPVIEFYLEKVDRAAIREQLKMTPAQRFDALQREVEAQAREKMMSVREEPSPWPRKKGAIEMGADPAWFAEAKAVPLLVADPVIEAYLKDVDRGLIRQALRLSVSERFERFHRLMQSAYGLRRACADNDA